MTGSLTPRDALSPEAFYSLYVGALSFEDESRRVEATCLLLLLGRLGVRPSELPHLHEGWIDWGRGDLTIPAHDPCGCAECWKRARKRKEDGDERSLDEIVSGDFWTPPGRSTARTVSFGWSNRITGALAAAFDERAYFDHDERSLQALVATIASNAPEVDGDVVTLRSLRASALSFFASVGIGPNRLADLTAVDEATAGAFARIGGGDLRQFLYRSLRSVDPPEFHGEDSPFRIVCDPAPFEREPFDTRQYDANWRVERARASETRPRNPRPADPPDGIRFDPEKQLAPREPAGNTGPGVVAESLADWVESTDAQRRRRAAESSPGALTSGSPATRPGGVDSADDARERFRTGGGERSTISTNAGPSAPSEAATDLPGPNAPPATGGGPTGGDRSEGTGDGSGFLDRKPGSKRAGESTGDDPSGDARADSNTSAAGGQSEDATASSSGTVDPSNLPDNPLDYVTGPVEFSVKTRFSASELDDGRPSGGTMALGQEEFVVLSRDNTGVSGCLQVDLNDVTDLSPGYKPSHLKDIFQETVGISYVGRDGEREVVVCEVPSESQWPFIQLIFSTIIDDIPAVVSNLHKYGRAVEAETMRISAFEQSLGFWTRNDSEAVATIRYDRIVDVAEGKMMHEEGYEIGVIIHQLISNEQVAQTQVRPLSDHHQKMLKRLLQIHLRRKKHQAQSVSLARAEVEILEALQRRGSGKDLVRILDTDSEQFDQSLATLEEYDLIKQSGGGIELTVLGFLVASSEYGVASGG